MLLPGFIVRSATQFSVRYREAVRHPGVPRLLGGYLVSAVGDGVGRIAVPWLALDIATPGTRGVVVAAVMLATTLPGMMAGLALNRVAGRLPARTLLVLNAALRGGALLAVAALHLRGLLSLPLLLTLLVLSSFADAWSDGGLLALLRDLVQGDLKPVNSLVRTSFSLSLAVGPALAGVILTVWGVSAALAIDALTFVALGAAAATLPGRSVTADGDDEDAERRSGMRILAGDAVLVRLLALTFGAVVLVGCVQVALPLYVDDHLAGQPAAFGLMWAGFGLGSTVGGLLAGGLKRIPLYQVAVAAALGWGVCLALGIESRSAVGAVAGFTVGGLIYGPYPVLVMTALQERLPAAHLASGSTAWHAVLLAAAPLGLLAGGLLTSVTTGLGTLRVAAYGIVALAIANGWRAYRRRPARGHLHA